MGKGHRMWVAGLVAVMVGGTGWWLLPSSPGGIGGVASGNDHSSAASPSVPGASLPPQGEHGDSASSQQAAAHPMQHAPSATAYLEFEAAMVHGSELSFDQAMLALKGDAFDHYMGLIAQQSLRVPEAAELTEAYSLSLEESVRQTPALSLQRLSCGLSLCAGSISTGSSADAAQFEHWRRTLSLSGSTPAYSMIEVTVDGKDGRVEHRFIFSSDAGINGIQGPALP